MIDLPAGWALPTLGELCAEVRNGISAKPDQEQGIPILRISAVRPMRLNTSDIRFLPDSFQQVDTYRLRADDLLFTRYNGTRELVGVCARVHELSYDLLYPDKLIRVRLRGELADPRFVERAAHTPAARNFITDKLKTSAGQLGISGAELKSLPVPLAPMPEQKRIADKLDTLLARVDACRERLDRVPTILKRFRQSVLAAATSGELTREWREERGLAADWKKVSLGSLLIDVRYGTSKKCYYEPEKTPVLRIPNVVDGVVNQTDLKYAEFDEAERAKLALAAGDLLMIRSNGSLGLVGRTALVSEREAGFLYAGYLIRLRADVAQAHPAFLSLSLASPESRAHIERTARSTTGVNNINTKEIRALPIRVPALDEQDEVVRRVGVLFEQAERLEHRIDQAQALVARTTPSTLAKAFRGELVPQDPNDEPASALLTRLGPKLTSPKPRAKPSTARSKAKQGALIAMTKKLLDVLGEADGWMPAQDAFRNCGIVDGCETDLVEGVYAELRELERTKRIAVKTIRDAQGRKVHDQLKFIATK